MYKNFLNTLAVVAIAAIFLVVGSENSYAQEGDENIQNTYLSIARIYYENGEPDKAINYLERIIEIDKFSKEAIKLLIRIHVQKGSIEKAQPFLALLKEINQNDGDLLYYEAFIYFDLEQYQRSLEHLHLLLDIDPDHELANALLIKVQQRLEVKPVAPFEIRFLSAS